MQLLDDPSGAAVLCLCIACLSLDEFPAHARNKCMKVGDGGVHMRRDSMSKLFDWRLLVRMSGWF